MSIKKFIKSVRESLDVDLVKKNSKRKSLKNFLKKLKERKEKLENDIKTNDNQDLKEELEIVILHIKKGRKILDKLNSDKETKE